MTRSIIVRDRFWIAILGQYLVVFILLVDQLATATPWAVHMRGTIEDRHEVLSALLPRIAMHTEACSRSAVESIPEICFASPPCVLQYFLDCERRASHHPFLANCKG